MPPMTDPELVGRTLQVLQPLLLHPEPLVWVHAARALGRLTGPFEQLEGHAARLGHRRVAAPAAARDDGVRVAARPSGSGSSARQLVSILDSPDDEAWALPRSPRRLRTSSSSVATSGIALAARILAGDGGAIAARALARGLATLWRRGARHGDVQRDIEGPLRALREMARSRARELARRVTPLDRGHRVTDAVDDAERDPLDLELGLENLMRLAAQYDDEEADARAARFAGLARADVPGSASHRARKRAAPPARRGDQRARRAARARSRSASGGRCWRRTPAGEPLEEPNLAETWKIIARAPAEILDLVKERRQSAGASLDADLPLEVLAIRLGGYALDACGEDSESRPRSRPDGARHLPLAAQARGPGRRLARAPAAAQGRAQHALLAPRRHDARHGARRGRRRASGSVRSPRGGRS